MPFKSRPGILYQNKGIVKVSFLHWAPIGESRIVSDRVRVFDLTKFIPVFGQSPNVLLFGRFSTKEEFDAHVHWDKERYLLTLDKGTENPENPAGFFENFVVLVAMYNIEPYNNYDEVSYIDKDNKCKIEKANRIGAIPFAHTLTQESAKNLVDKIVSSYSTYYKEGWILDDDIKIGGVRAEVLRYRNTRKIGGANFGQKFKRFFHWNGIPKENDFKRRVNKCKLYKVRLRTNKRYTSNAIRVSVAMQKGKSGNSLKYHLVALD